MQHLGLVVHQKYPLGLHGAVLCISSGSIVHFEGDAIVNSANLYLKSGGGVNGTICEAGGPRLREAMEATPLVQSSDGTLVRCPTGESRLTMGGELKVPWCIHTVAPNYVERQHLPTNESDSLLTSAYTNSMLHAASAGVKSLAFSLLSSGAFCGSRGLQEVLKIGVAAVRSCAYDGLQEVHLVSFNGKEFPELEHACLRSDPRFIIRENASLVHPNDLPTVHSHYIWLGEKTKENEVPNTPGLSKAQSEGVMLLGNRRVAENVEALRLLNVSHVVNCAMSQVASPLHQVQEVGCRSVEYCLINLDDAPNKSSSGKNEIPFDERALDAFCFAAEFIDQALQSSPDDGRGGPVVFVHCVDGVKRMRSVIAPNAGLFRLLLHMERVDHGFETMQRPLSVNQQDYKNVDFVGQPLQFLAIGDWGWPSEELKQVACAMAKEAEQTDSKFVLGLGDNFYPSGVKSVNDKLFREFWQDVFLIYPSLCVPWKHVLGNHDYEDNPQAQIDFTSSSRNPDGLWQMRDRNYRFSWPLNGGKYIEFFALDTNGCQNSVRRRDENAEQNLHNYIAELDYMLARSRATWKVVFAHHPMYTRGASHGILGRCLRDKKYVKEKGSCSIPLDGYDLESVLVKHGVHAYISGHEHVFQHHFAGGVGHFVCGASGAEHVGFYKGEANRKDGPAWADQKRNAGFVRLEVTSEIMVVLFINKRGEVIRMAKRRPNRDWIVDEI